MANITIPRKTFEKEIGKLDEAMQEKIAYFGTPIESITENEMQIEIFPNRPDMLSYHGFKRSFLSYLGKSVGLKKYTLLPPEKDFKIKIDSSVKDVRPYTACAIVKGLTFNDDKIKEIIEIQEKIHFTVGRKRKKLAIGIYPLEQIKLPITYKALEPDQIKFIPLESEKEMSGLQILQRHPAGRDYAHLLAGKAKFPIFVDADNQILSMPPIINSEKTGRITEKTKDVFIECSGFDMGILKKTLNIIVTTLADMGGKIYQMELVGLKEKTPNLDPEKMKINIQNVNKLLGLELNEKEIKQYLERMGHNYLKGEVEIPAWRVDILHEVDLIEEIAIAYGYKNFVPEIPSISTIGEINPKELAKTKVSEILAGLGLLEISNYHLTSRKNQFSKMGIAENQEKDFLEVLDSKTEYNIMRKDLSHYSLKILSENIDAEYPQKLFEIGRVFSKDGTEIKEKESLCIAIAPGNYTELKQIIEYLGKMVNKEIKMKEAENGKIPPHFIDGRTAEIQINNKTIGIIGEIHPKILKNWKIKIPVATLEINFDDLID
ncbi:MAG: phenylalanine--tRNA ligase subunit beta [Nanoarchaeota archaeon]|nr:phenylalanine--tRNA ligase subunit beta [Nanoarchaeota archaeon]